MLIVEFHFINFIKKMSMPDAAVLKKLDACKGSSQSQIIHASPLCLWFGRNSLLAPIISNNLHHYRYLFHLSPFSIIFFFSASWPKIPKF